MSVRANPRNDNVGPSGDRRWRHLIIGVPLPRHNRIGRRQVVEPWLDPMTATYWASVSHASVCNSRFPVVSQPATPIGGHAREGGDFVSAHGVVD